MTNRPKIKGTKFETACARYLAAETGQPVRRRAQTGSADQGDLEGLAIGGLGVAIECKDYGRPRYARHMAETAAEKRNARADIGVLIEHAQGMGAGHMAEQWAMLTLGDLVRIINAANGRQG